MHEQIEHCPFCKSSCFSIIQTYYTKISEKHFLYKCENCNSSFSDTYGSFLHRLRTPVALIILVLNSLSEGMGINASARIFKISKNTIYSWLNKFTELRKVLFLHSLCVNYVKMVVEGDELYTKVNSNVPQEDSLGWTIVFIERRTRFIWLMQCGKKDKKLFKDAIRILYEVIKQTQDFKLFTDGERRYSKMLFEICFDLIYTGRRPRKTLKKGIQVRIKNKGSRNHKPGPKPSKYVQPKQEHPETINDIENSDIHANHTEAFNASLRRKCAAYRRRTNTYAKVKEKLQQRLDLHWIKHNFIDAHYTTKKVPAIDIGIIDNPFSWEQIFNLRVG